MDILKRNVLYDNFKPNMGLRRIDYSMVTLSKVEEAVLESILQKFIPNDENYVRVTYDIFPSYMLNNIEQYLRGLKYKAIIASYSQTLSDCDINLTPDGIAYFKNKKKSIFPRNSKELLKQLLEHDNPVEYMQYLFKDLDSNSDARLRAMMKDLKESGYISTLWGSGVPYHIVFNEKAYSFNEDEPLSMGNGNTYIFNIKDGNANINSVDNSTRTVNNITNETELFDKMLGVASNIADDTKKELIDAIRDMQMNYGKPSLKEMYYKFIEIAANHMSLFAPFLPALTEMLH